MFEDDRSYFSQRAADEAMRAEQATKPEVAAVHSELAAAYRARAGSDGTLKRTANA